MAGAPSVKHGGFLVPNASKANPGNPTRGVEWARMAEVDQVDFNSLSQISKWSVLHGCQVSVAGTTCSLVDEGGLPGLAIVNGNLVEALPLTSDVLGPSSEMDRFDIVVLTAGGSIKVVRGLPDFDPVLPEPDIDQTILAAVYCPTSETSFSDCVIDKRVMTPKSLLTKIDSQEYLVRNVQDKSSNFFTLRGSGEMNWLDDTSIRRVDVGTLRVQDNINLTGRFQANGDVTAQNLVARNLLTGRNLFQGNTITGDEPKGALRQALDGRLFLNGPDGWIEMATIDVAAPTGTIMQSVCPPSELPRGWVQLNGDTISELQHPMLFMCAMLDRFIQTGGSSPVAPARLMNLPNLTNKILIGTQTAPDFSGSNSLTLKLDHLPKHSHGVTIRDGGGHTPTGVTADNGGHSHVQLPESDGNPSGAHSHTATTLPHKHNGMEFPGQNSRVIAEVWGGGNKIDGPFNDRNHTSSVEPLEWTAPATVDVTVTRAGSGHTHVLDTAPHHRHTVTMNQVPDHGHVLSEQTVGNGLAIDLRQEAFSVFMYVKD